MGIVLIAVLLVLIDIVVAYLFWIGAPYIPTKASGVRAIVEACGLHEGEKAADIGSGDGRILIAFAQNNIEAHGFEINPFLVWWSRRKIKNAGLQHLAFVHQQNLWQADLSPFNAVTVFGAFHLMRRLEKKFRRELRHGARVVSLGFEFPTWPIMEKRGSFFLYQQNSPPETEGLH